MWDELSGKITNNEKNCCIGCIFRKPNIGLARKAKIDFPQIDFDKSIMAGDSLSDLEFGKNAGMHTIFISDDDPLIVEYKDIYDFTFNNLKSFADKLLQ